jgi:hypothetical protein
MRRSRVAATDRRCDVMLRDNGQKARREPSRLRIAGRAWVVFDLGVQNYTASDNSVSENMICGRPADREDWMHGGMQVLDLSSERFQRQAEECLERASAIVDLGYRSLWDSLALDCLRIAAAIPERNAFRVIGAD